ncbi:immunity 49 family protein [Saccharopolyspora shandongensis]
MLESVQRKALLRTRFRSAFDPAGESAEFRESLSLSGAAGSAFFATAKLPSGEFDFTIRERMALKATGPTTDHTPPVWLESLWACLISRDELSSDELCVYPVDTLRDNDSSFPAFFYSWANAVAAFCLRDDDALTKLNTALADTDPDTVGPDALELALRIYYPQMKVLHYLATQEAEAFNTALAQAVEHHKEFWTGDRQRATDPDGFFSLPLTAMAAIAHDIGMAVTVDSEYLPNHVITSGEQDDEG